MATFVNQAKSASPTFLTILRHGTAARIIDIQDNTFNDVIFLDGTLVRDATFNQLIDIVWDNMAKSASPTFVDITRS